MMMVKMNTITIYSSDYGNADDSNDGDDNTNDITDGDGKIDSNNDDDNVQLRWQW